MAQVVLADVAVGWLIPALGVFALFLLLIVALGEAAVLSALRWGTFRRCVGDALLMNVISTVPGFIIAQQFPDLQFAGLVAAFGLSVGIEGLVLALLRRHPATMTWKAALLANAASYLVIAGIYLAD